MMMVFQVIFLLLLVVLNGFFVTSEFVLVTVRKTHIDELARNGDITAALLSDAVEELNRYISATQLGITMASLGLGWLGETTVVRLIDPLLFYIPKQIGFVTVHGVATVLAFILVTFVTIVFGELAPKIIALQRTEKVGFLIIRPLRLFATFFQPAVWLLNKSGNIVVSRFGLNGGDIERQTYSEGEISMIANSSAASGAIQKEEADLVYKALRLDDIAISEIMVPRKDIRAIASDTELQDVVTLITKDVHSRFPVYKDSLDNIIGFVHVKHVYRLLLSKQEMTPLLQLKIMRKIIFVIETKKASEVLVEMRNRQQHMAIVVNKKNKVIGLVTMEDIFESLVGEIEDEF